MTEIELDDLLSFIEKLMTLDPDLDTPQGRLLKSLAEALSKYESEVYQL
jgi:hypothetical protein